MAAGLLALGILPEQRVAIASSTRVEWLYEDLAIVCAGAATTAVHSSTVRADGEWVLNPADLRALGTRHLVENPAAVDDVVAAVGPEHLATLIYTSGTTGRPKGVELPHRCWTYIGAGAEAIEILRPDDLHYLWLPLSHSFGKMLVAVQLQIGFTTAVDGRLELIVDNLAVVRPTFMAGPPRIFEKVHAKVVQTVQEEGRIKRSRTRPCRRTCSRVWTSSTPDRTAGRPSRTSGSSTTTCRSRATN